MRRRSAWKAAAAFLLALLSGALGCHAMSDHLRNRAFLSATLPVPGQPPAPSSIASLAKEASLPVDKESESSEKKWTAKAEAKETKRDKTNSKSKRADGNTVYQVDRKLPSPAEGMAIPTIPFSDKVRPISLAAALAQAGVENPVLNIARQALQSALGLQLQARVLMLPNVNIGAYYGNHSGPIQSSFGAIRKLTRQTLDYGFGTFTDAANTIKIPGLLLNVPLTDAIFEPRAAEHVVANRGFLATATRNDIFLEVSTTYLALMNAEARLAVIRQSERDFEEVVRLTAAFAKRGKGRYGDADRAEADLQALRYHEQQAQQDVAVTSADLAQLLNLDPSTRLVTGDIPLQVVQFVDPKISLPTLLELAERNHPAILAASAAVRAGQVRVRQETVRPLLPNLWMGLSATDFGGGAVATTNNNGVYNPHTGNTNLVTFAPNGGATNPPFGKISGRVDVDVIAYWTLQNMGMGNLAHIRQRRAERNQAEAARLQVLNDVRDKVSAAYNTSAEQFLAISVQRRRVQEATDGFQRDLETSFRGIVLPIEILDNAKRLREGREALLESVIGFDRAQFQLFVALGQPPNLVVEDDKPLPSPPTELPPP